MWATKQAATIVARASGPGPGGVAVIRLSGAMAFEIAQKMTKKKQMTPRYAHLADFFDTSGDVIDHGIVLFFPNPHSYTGEPVIEFQGHGGQYIVQKLVSVAMEHGAILAKPGEFTERAFLNGKLDLVQAEAVCDLISAVSEKQATAANNSLQGAYSTEVMQLQTALESIRVAVEANIDFSEQDIPTESASAIQTKIHALSERMQAFITKVARGVRERNGLQVVLCGPPNAGKSSLLNYLTQHETAIVTDIPGTTRDLLHADFIHKGHAFHLTDTAGLRESEDPVEKLGIERAKEAIKQADCIWLVEDVTTPPSPLSNYLSEDTDKKKCVRVGNKQDLLTKKAPSGYDVTISVKSAQGIDRLLDTMCETFFHDTEQATFSARARHLQLLQECVHSLDKAKKQPISQIDLLAEDLRQAQHCLANILGEYSNENLLDAIFREFCLGK